MFDLISNDVDELAEILRIYDKTFSRFEKAATDKTETTATVGTPPPSWRGGGMGGEAPAKKFVILGRISRMFSVKNLYYGRDYSCKVYQSLSKNEPLKKVFI